MSGKGNDGRLPPLPENPPGIPTGNRYKEQYGVVLVCPNEDAQRKVFEGLAALAPCKIKVVVT